MSDRRVAAIPVQERGEALVDVRKQDTAGAWTTSARACSRGCSRRKRCSPAGSCCTSRVTGLRPLQRRYFEEYSGKLARVHPGWRAAELREAASRFVSPPEIAPHSAGTAVDVTLIDDQGPRAGHGHAHQRLPRGVAPDLGARARTNRAAPGGALSTAGLINYGTEWWHWSFGDRYWALQTQQPAVLYGLVELP